MSAVLAAFGLYLLAGFLIGSMSIIFSHLQFKLGWKSSLDSKSDIVLAGLISLFWPVALPTAAIIGLFTLVNFLCEKVLQ